MVQGFLGTQKLLISKRTIDINYSGTTAITILLRNNLCICANAGDSRAIIGRCASGWQSVELSTDHKPNFPYERRRILASGGRVEPFREENGELVGPDRVWLQHEQLPGLAMSRSIGDLVAAHVGVISEPEISVYEMNEYDKFIVLASDGIWEFISNSEVIKIVAEFYKKNQIDEACDAVAQEAIRRWKQEDNVIDDITIIIAFLDV